MKIRKSLLAILIAAVAMMLTSCQKESVKGFETGNPLPGSWLASQVEYEGLPVDFKVDIQDVFREGEGVYQAEGLKIGRMEVTHEGAPVMAADILNCIYNSNTYTGKFVIHYDDDEDPDYVFSMYFYYDPKLDRFTVIEISYNITFCRK